MLVWGFGRLRAQPQPGTKRQMRYTRRIRPLPDSDLAVFCRSGNALSSAADATLTIPKNEGAQREPSLSRAEDAYSSRREPVRTRAPPKKDPIMMAS